jgi:hypothetical protein
MIYLANLWGRPWCVSLPVLDALFVEETPRVVDSA